MGNETMPNLRGRVLETKIKTTDAAAEICINSLNPDNFWDEGKCRLVTKWEGLNSVEASIKATFELCAEAFKELVMYQFGYEKKGACITITAEKVLIACPMYEEVEDSMAGKIDYYFCTGVSKLMMLNPLVRIGIILVLVALQITTLKCAFC